MRIFLQVVRYLSETNIMSYLKILEDDVSEQKNKPTMTNIQDSWTFKIGNIVVIFINY